MRGFAGVGLWRFYRKILETCLLKYTEWILLPEQRKLFVQDCKLNFCTG